MLDDGDPLTGWIVRGSNPVGGEIFRTLQIGAGVHPASYTMRTGSFSGEKGQGVALTTHPHLAQVKERGELYIYSPSRPSWPVIGWTLTLPFTPYDDRFRSKHVALEKGVHVTRNSVYLLGSRRCGHTAERLLPASRTPAVTEAMNVLTARKMF